jgi:hypothetical protein
MQEPASVFDMKCWFDSKTFWSWGWQNVDAEEAAFVVIELVGDFVQKSYFYPPTHCRNSENVQNRESERKTNEQEDKQNICTKGKGMYKRANMEKNEKKFKWSRFHRNSFLRRGQGDLMKNK